MGANQQCSESKADQVQSRSFMVPGFRELPALYFVCQSNIAMGERIIANHVLVDACMSRGPPDMESTWVQSCFLETVTYPVACPDAFCSSRLLSVRA